MEKVYSDRMEADIFASDMKENEEESKIAATFDGATVFLTGATGFSGKLFMEKSLRSCPKSKMIYISVRPKKGKDVETRFEEIFEGPNMVPLKVKNPKFSDKVSIINGDCTLPDLGMDEETKKKIIKETSFVIHCAATVRFDEKLQTASYTNVRAVRDSSAMAKQMKGLKAFSHVSTAYSHCIRKDVDEEFYKAGMDPDKLLDLVDEIDEERLTKITPGLLGEWPNTYVFTKAVAEELIKREINTLPIAIIRPSIVISTVNEPIKGFIDNFYGPSGVMVGAALGVLRTLQGRPANIAELIPADYVINAGLAVVWAIVNQRNHQNGATENMASPIYNVVSSPETPITWKDFNESARKHAVTVPSELQVWHNYFRMRENYYHNLSACFLLHTVPAYIVDFICICLRKEPMMVKGYKKINKFMTVLGYFALREWRFSNRNSKNSWQKMGAEDKEQFQFSMKDFDWDDFFHYYSRGGRAYSSKDPSETIPKGRVKYWKSFVAHYTLVAVSMFLFFKSLCLLCSCIY